MLDSAVDGGKCSTCSTVGACEAGVTRAVVAAVCVVANTMKTGGIHHTMHNCNITIQLK